jgi:predicted ATPase/class 3 adenylate cyclase
MDERWAIFLFTDIAGSTKLWEQYPREMDDVLAQHDHLLRQVVESHQGQVFKTVGDAIYAAFQMPVDAVEAAIEGQLALSRENWPGVNRLQVRMALHMGIAVRREGDFFGPTLNRLSRLLDAGHGGQIILSQAIADGVIDQLPPDFSLRDLSQHRLKDLSRPEHIFQVIAPGLPDVFPALRTLDYRPHNLPTAVSSFIGREEELKEVKQLLSEHRLVSLTGPAGTGKTRLGLQAAAELLEDFPDGVFFVSLAALRYPDLVPEVIADALGITVNERETALEALVRYLRDRQMLLLLDNFEQIYEAGPLVGELLVTVPHLHILVTTRQRLDIYGEYEYPVPVLDVPDSQEGKDWLLLARNDSVELFIQRAIAAKPVYSLTPENAADIAEICRRLDGLPLAIELAAARLKYFSLATLRQRLRSRLQILTAGPRDVPTRQRTMRQAIDWSYQLLDSGEQTLLAQLGVFVDGWTLAAAEAVVADLTADDRSRSVPFGPIEVFEGLSSLIDKSLIQMHEMQEGDPRFYMLETIREYALERLEADGDLDAVRRRHLIYFTFLVEKQDSPSGQMSTQAIRWLSDEYCNISSALEWAFNDHPGLTGVDHRSLATRLSLAMCNFWYKRGYLNEGRRRLEAVLDLNREPEKIRAKALLENGIFAWQQGDYVASQEDLEQSVVIYRQMEDIAGLARALHYLGHLLFDQRLYPEADTYFNESRNFYLNLKDPTLSLILLSDTGMVAYHQGDRQTAKERFEEALSGFRDQGAGSEAADQLNRLGDLARLDQDLDDAIALYDESLALFRKSEDSLGVASCLHKLGQICLKQEGYDRAHSLFKQSLNSQQKVGNKQGIAECLAAYAGLACATGQCELAAELIGTTDAFLEELGAPLSPADKQDLELVKAEMMVRLGDIRFQELYQKGRLMSLDDGIATIQDLAMAH